MDETVNEKLARLRAQAATKKFQEDNARRKKWDFRFLSVASTICLWSKEPNTRVGCVIVDSKNRIVATGYNGFARGVRDTVDRIADRDLKLSMTIHAEENALLYAGRDVDGCTAYVTHLPCSLCMTKLIQGGVKRVVYSRLTDESFKKRWGESLELSARLAAEAGVKLEESEFTDSIVEVIK